jgi:lipopolysaccharide biosynthesis regulator YciM
MNALGDVPQELPVLLSILLALALVGLVLLWVGRRRRAGRSRRRNADTAGGSSSPFERGFALLLDAHRQEAAALLSTAIKDDPTRIPEYLELAKLCRRQDEPGKAARMFEQLLMRPELGEEARSIAQYELALAYAAMGHHAHAIQLLDSVLGTHPSHAEARRELRRIHEEIGEWETAAALEMIRLQRGETVERRTLAALLTQQGKASWAAGNKRDSAAPLQSALTLDPDGIEAALYLGRLHLRRGHIQEAFHVWDGLARRRPEFLFLAFRDIQTAFRQQRHDTGWESFLRAFTEHHPGDPTGHLALAEWFETCGQVDESRRCLRHVLDLDPGCREAHLALLSLYRAQGVPDEVLNTYAQLAEAGPRTAAGRFHCRVCGAARNDPFGKCQACDRWGTAERQLPPMGGVPVIAGDIAPPHESSSPDLFPPLAMRRKSFIRPTAGI